MKQKFSTVQVAKMLGLRQPHLQRAIAQGRVTAPPLIQIGQVKIRLWSQKDVQRARKQLQAPPKNGRRTKQETRDEEGEGLRAERRRNNADPYTVKPNS